MRTAEQPGRPYGKAPHFGPAVSRWKWPALLLSVAGSGLLTPSCEAVVPEEEPTFVRHDGGLAKDAGGRQGDLDYCSSRGCGLGEGDCDQHRECAAGLFCGSNNGAEYGLPPSWDVCTATCPVFDAGRPGTTFCSPACPCTVGQGDCDHHAECAPGLVCRHDRGVEVGLPADFDVCGADCPSFDPAAPDPLLCSAACPCARHQGDCDGDAECADGLVCVADRGAFFGLPEWFDVCDVDSPTKLLFWGQDKKVRWAPGNSAPAIENAYALGYDGVEVDLRLTADARIVLMHGTALEEISTGTGTVYETTLEQLLGYELLPVQLPPVRFATLEEALTLTGTRGVLLGDMKTPLAERSAVFGALELALARASFDPARLLVSTYGLAQARLLKQALPWARVLVKSYLDLIAVTDADVEGAAAARMTGLMLQLPADVTTVEPLLTKLHDRGLILVLFVHYASGTFETLDALRDMGVDYVLTVHEEYL